MAKKASNKKPTSPAPNPQRDMFVIMPFSGTKSCTEEQWTDIFENVFSPAAEAAGLVCSRARVSTGSLIKSIVERLRTSYIVLADITDANPNVFYELGVRHSLSKRTIIVAQGANHIPSDLRGYWSLVYGTGPGQVKKFAKDLKDIVDQIDAEPERPDSPVGDYLEREFVQSSRQAGIEVTRRLSALHTELTAIETKLADFEAQRTAYEVAMKAGGDEAMRYLLESTSLKLGDIDCRCLCDFLDIRYVDPGPDLLAYAYEIREAIRAISSSWQSLVVVSTVLKLLAIFRSRVRDLRKKVADGSFSFPEQNTVIEWTRSANCEQGSLPILLECSNSISPKAQAHLWSLSNASGLTESFVTLEKKLQVLLENVGDSVGEA